MLQVSVSRGVVRDALWWTLAVVVLCHLLHQPPAPPERTAHRQPAERPGREPEREGSEHGGEPKVTPIPRAAGFATEAVPA